MKLKYILQGILITLIVAIILHFITIERLANEIIYVKELPMITKRFTSLNESIEGVEDDTCRVSFDKMLNRIKDTYFSKNVTIEKYVNAYSEDEKNFIDFYEEVIDSCKLEKNDDIYFLVLSSLNYPNSVKNRYILRYEFSIRDTLARDDLYKNSDEIGTYTTKLLEIQVINKLLEEVKK